MAELEVLRMVAAALADATIGVNTKLLGVPRDAEDAVHVPPPVTIADSTRDNWVARNDVQVKGLPGGTFPALAVRLYQDADINGEIQNLLSRDSTWSVLIEYVQRNADSAGAARDALYTMRAVTRSLAELHREESAATRRTRNGISLYACMAIKQVALFEQRGDVITTTALIVKYHVRDTQPFT